MKEQRICQSCSMPMDSTDLMGTERDGTLSADYCKYCYRLGEFTSPGITLEEMREKMSGMMDQDKLPEDILEAAISRLPHLKRWRKEG